MTTAAVIQDKCKRCGSRLIRNYDEIYCINCGPIREVQISGPVKNKTRAKTYPAGPADEEKIEKGVDTLVISRDLTIKGSNIAPTGDPLVPPPTADKLHQTDPAKTPVPAKPAKGGNAAIHYYYEGNKQAILNDLDTLGRIATEERWKINSGTMTGLLHNWRPEVIHKRTPGKIKQNKPKISKPAAVIPPPCSSRAIAHSQASGL